MVETVDLVFNYGGTWILHPKLAYLKKLTHVWRGYDVDLLSYIDICAEFRDKIGCSEVRHILITDPYGSYYLVEGDEGIRKLQTLFSKSFKAVNLFALDNPDVAIDQIPNINSFKESNVSLVDYGTDCGSSEEEECEEEIGSDYDNEELEVFSKKRLLDIDDKLEKYKVLEYGMTFKDLDEAKQVIAFYAVANKRNIHVKKSDKGRVSYGCETGCPFYCFISRDGKDQGFKMKKLNQDHSCDESFENGRASSKVLAHYFKAKIQGNPKYKVKDMTVDLKGQFNLTVNKTKLKRAKKLALDRLDGSYSDEFNKLEAYAQELRLSNPGSDVVINLSKDAMEEGKRKFLRMYVCFQALKDGWKGGLRPLIGLDGTFLKGKSYGILLVAVGQDASNHFYPLAWAVVDRETKRTWTWFVELLKHSLDLKDGEGITFMSDMQKGLIFAGFM